VTGPGIIDAHAYQNVVLTLDGESVVVNGSGGYDAAYMGDDENGGSCEFEAHFTMAAQNVTLLMTTGGCPTTGTVLYNGNLQASCTGGEGDFDVSGSYSVTSTFGGTEMTTTVTSGGNFWTYTEPCS
jgi:hypothetical protein